MKFENPIMNISMFELENVVTVVSGNEPEVLTNEATATKYVTNNLANANAIISFNFNE